MPGWLMETFTVGCRSSRTQASHRGEAVAAATSEAARVCGLKHRKGLLRKGYDADLIVVDGDLKTDLTALQRVRLVVLAGKSVG
jgi:imidazolonepropionase-like amidohydrolase